MVPKASFMVCTSLSQWSCVPVGVAEKQSGLFMLPFPKECKPGMTAT